jgi:hypothetical protein
MTGDITRGNNARETSFSFKDAKKKMTRFNEENVSPHGKKCPRERLKDMTKPDVCQIMTSYQCPGCNGKDEPKEECIQKLEEEIARNMGPLSSQEREVEAERQIEKWLTISDLKKTKKMDVDCWMTHAHVYVDTEQELVDAYDLHVAALRRRSSSSNSLNSTTSNYSEEEDSQTRHKRLKPIRALKQYQEQLRDYEDTNDSDIRDADRTKEQHRDRCKDQVYLNDDQEVVTVTLGHCQTQIKARQAIPVTIISILWWSQYINWNASMNNTHMTWQKFRMLSRRERLHFAQDVWIDDENHHIVFGPFQALFLIGSVEVLSMVYITFDPSFRRMMLGRQVWSPIPCKANAQARCEIIQNEAIGEVSMKANARVDMDFTTCSITALCDTGAGITLMPRVVYEKIGFKIEALLPVMHMMKGANGACFQSMGMSEPIEFKIENTPLEASFVVVDKLLDNNIILGRDFMITYDILVDVPAQRLIIRNPNRKYFTKITSERKNDAIRCTVTPQLEVRNANGTKQMICDVAPVQASCGEEKWLKLFRNPAETLKVHCVASSVWWTQLQTYRREK